MEILTEWYSIAGFLVGMIIVLMLLGLPVAFAFLTTNIIGAAIFMGDGTLTGGLDAMPLIVSCSIIESSFTTSVPSASVKLDRT